MALGREDPIGDLCHRAAGRVVAGVPAEDEAAAGAELEPGASAFPPLWAAKVMM